MSWMLETDDGHCPQDLTGEYERAAISAPPEDRRVDDTTGKYLPPDLARRERLEQLSDFHSEAIHNIVDS